MLCLIKFFFTKYFGNTAKGFQEFLIFENIFICGAFVGSILVANTVFPCHTLPFVEMVIEICMYRIPFDAVLLRIILKNLINFRKHSRKARFNGTPFWGAKNIVHIMPWTLCWLCLYCSAVIRYCCQSSLSQDFNKLGNDFAVVQGRLTAMKISWLNHFSHKYWDPGDAKAQCQL